MADDALKVAQRALQTANRAAATAAELRTAMEATNCNLGELLSRWQAEQSDGIAAFNENIARWTAEVVDLLTVANRTVEVHLVLDGREIARSIVDGNLR